MQKLSVLLIILGLIEGDCWKPVVINTVYRYEVKDEGRSFKPLYLENYELVNADVIIDGDTTRRIKMGFSSPFPIDDTVRIELFDNEETYAHLFKIMIIKNLYLIKYSREINDTEIVQKFKPIKSELELNSPEFSYGSKVRGHVEYEGTCVSGCSGKNKKVRIEGNFAVTIHRN